MSVAWWCVSWCSVNALSCLFCTERKLCILDFIQKYKQLLLLGVTKWGDKISGGQTMWCVRRDAWIKSWMGIGHASRPKLTRKVNSSQRATSNFTKGASLCTATLINGQPAITVKNHKEKKKTLFGQIEVWKGGEEEEEVFKLSDCTEQP